MSDEFWVRIDTHDSRTGKHTRREGPYSEEEAEKLAADAASRCGVTGVMITKGSPYHTGSVKAGTSNTKLVL